jgi:hypothetical protein
VWSISAAALLVSFDSDSLFLKICERGSLDEWIILEDYRVRIYLFTVQPGLPEGTFS